MLGLPILIQQEGSEVAHLIPGSESCAAVLEIGGGWGRADAACGPDDLVGR